MVQVENRDAAPDAKHDPLAKVHAVVPCEAFRSRLENVWRKPPDQRKSNAGCKPPVQAGGRLRDAIVMFKAVLLCALHNLSDDRVESRIRDRLSFVRFPGRDPGLALEDKVLATKACPVIGASIVEVPEQRTSRADNAQIRQGETPEAWADKPTVRQQKDTDARWTKKHGKRHAGYPNPVTIDRRSKLVGRYRVTDAPGSRQPGG